MLNIPNQIITLFKTDSVRKNFRVIFPNGECTDLTNDDIVAGTVQFTESICSKDVLQFGLAESSRIQFECVNVPNVYGAVIECAIEIDTSSLSTADITSIQANQGDGVLVLENDSDIGFGFYRVPYGTFTITSCPRSSGAMWKRRVEAYNGYVDKMSKLLNDKLSKEYTNTEMVQNIPLLLAQESQTISDLPLTQTTETIQNTTYDNYGGSTVSWTYNGDNYKVYLWGVGFPAKQFRVVDSALFRFTCDIDLTVHEQLYADVIACGIPEDKLMRIKEMLQPGVCINSFVPSVGVSVMFDDPKDSGYIYPYEPASQRNNFIWYPEFQNSDYPDGYEIFMEINDQYSTRRTYMFTSCVSNAVLTKYTLNNTALTLLNLKLKPSWQMQGAVNCRYTGTVDVKSLQEGFHELCASFGHNGRNNTFESIHLTKASPVALNADEYASLWWDEFDISPIGSVLITYKDIDVGQEQTIEYTFGDGLSTYDMTNNYLLKNLGVSVADLSGTTYQTLYDYVKDLIDALFVPNVQDIAFTPVKLDALGLPCLESGDYLEIDDGNNGTVGTYIMNHTLTGEQLLMDDVESKGGEIIGNARSA